MFTGLIEEIGLVKNLIKKSDGYNLTVSSKIVLEETKIGDSISVNGACQTVTGLDKDSFTDIVSTITGDSTTLGSCTPGQNVNLERAMTPSSRFGGHIVQGHVDGTGKIKSIAKDANGVEIEIVLENEILKYIVGKGSVSVDGISLTVVTVNENSFSIYLIPETIGNTIFDEWTVDSDVNVEVDILAKYIERMINMREKSNEEKDLNLMNKLVENGFA